MTGKCHGYIVVVVYEWQENVMNMYGVVNRKMFIKLGLIIVSRKRQEYGRMFRMIM